MYQKKYPNVNKHEIGLFRIDMKGVLQLVKTGNTKDIAKAMMHDTIPYQKYCIIPIYVAGEGL